MKDDWILSIPGWLTAHEGEFLSKAAQSVRYVQADVVEIGSYLGKSTLYLGRSADHITAIDPHEGNFSGGTSSPTYKGFIKNIERAGVEHIVSPLVTTSKTAARNWKKPISLLFIDGLHDEAHAKEDFLLWSPFVVRGGIIAMHDAFCGWDGSCSVAMSYIIQSDAFSEIGVVGSIIYGVKGNAQGIKRINKLFRKSIISLCQKIYKESIVPQWVRFILVHKLLRILLLNRFSSFV